MAPFLIISVCISAFFLSAMVAFGSPSAAPFFLGMVFFLSGWGLHIWVARSWLEPAPSQLYRYLRCPELVGQMGIAISWFFLSQQVWLAGGWMLWKCVQWYFMVQDQEKCWSEILGPRFSFYQEQVPSLFSPLKTGWRALGGIPREGRALFFELVKPNFWEMALSVLAVGGLVVRMALHLGRLYEW